MQILVTLIYLRKYQSSGGMLQSASIVHFSSLVLIYIKALSDIMNSYLPKKIYHLRMNTIILCMQTSLTYLPIKVLSGPVTSVSGIMNPYLPKKLHYLRGSVVICMSTSLLYSPKSAERACGAQIMIIHLPTK